MVGIGMTWRYLVPLWLMAAINIMQFGPTKALDQTSIQTVNPRWIWKSVTVNVTLQFDELLNASTVVLGTTQYQMMVDEGNPFW